MLENEVITSRQNPRLVRARAVRDGRERSLIFIEGTRLVDEAFRSRLEIVEMFIADDLYGEGTSAGFGSPALRVKRSVFQSISATDNPQGIIAIAKRPRSSLDGLRRRSADSEIPCIVYLYEANNPANLGAILRVVEAAGAAGVITSKGSTDAFSPKSLRASMGSAFRLPIVEGVELSDVSGESGLPLCVVDIAGDKPHTQVDWTIPRLLVFGSEAHGLPDDILRKADQGITIPMNAEVESLNLAVSAGVILFEARRQVVVSD